MNVHVATMEDPNLGRPLPLKLSQIERFEGQPRKYFDESSIESLSVSIANDGQEQPIKVCRDPERKGVFIIIDGERRWRAFHRIQARTGVEPIVLAFIDIVKNVKEHFRKSTIANLHREDMHELDEAAALYQLYKEGDTLEQLSALRGKSATYVQGYIKLHELPESVKRLMDPNRPKDKRLATTSAIDIARSTNDADLRLELALEAVNRNLGVSEVKLLVGQRAQPSENYGVGGRKITKGDQYRVLKSYLGKLLKDSKRYNGYEDRLENLYLARDDELVDRKNDAATIRATIDNLTKLLHEVEKTPDWKKVS